MERKLKKKYCINILIALTSSAIIILSSLVFADLYETFELKTVDLRFQMRKVIPQRQDILFLEMDEQAIQDLGRWPWPRDTFARIINVLKELQAKMVLFDVTFTEPSQLFIDREKLTEGLRLEENKNILQDFLNDTEESLKQGQISLNEAGESFSQIRQGLDVWKEGINDTLNEAIKDSDLMLSEAVKEAGNVYLGYKLEVIHTRKDISRNAAYPQFKKQLEAEVKQDPKVEFTKLPDDLKHNPFFTAQETNHLLTRAKIHNLLSSNPELSPEGAADSLGEKNLATLRPEYNDLKAEIYGEKIEEALRENPQSSFKELVWETGIIEPANIQLLEKQYEEYILEEAFSKKVGIPYDGKGFLQAIKASPPILALVNSMRQAGFLNAIPDRDGVLRRVPLFIRYKEKIYPHITLWLLASLWQADLKKDFKFNPGEPVRIKEKYIPVDVNGSLLLNWAGKWKDSFRHLSCSDIYRLWQLENNLKNNLKLSEAELKASGLEKQFAQDKKKLEETKEKLQKQIKESICLIGLTAPGTHDYNPIPLQPDYPMLGTHANILNTILEGKFIKEAGPRINLMAILLLSLLIGVCVTALSPIAGLACASTILILYCFASIFLFNSRGLLIDMVRPVSAILLSYIGINSYGFATEEKEKRWIRKAFGHYVSRNVMEEILKDPSKLKLGGQRKNLTVLFSDIRSFTSYSEKHQPEEVVAVLNEYLNEMTNIVFKYNGTLDKYVGDEIMAIFGAPSAEEQADHAQRAVLTALEMMEKLRQLQEKWLSEGKEPFDIGIGINTGPMLVGNMGSTERMDYTVIGDAVNLGARVETLTRQYNNHIIISEFTYAYVKDLVEAKKLDEVKVKGKEKPVLMYEVLRLKTVETRPSL